MTPHSKRRHAPSPCPFCESQSFKSPSAPPAQPYQSAANTNIQVESEPRCVTLGLSDEREQTRDDGVRVIQIAHGPACHDTR